MKFWRIYRLPGSRENWHLDSGCGTDILNVRGFDCRVKSRSIDIGGDNVPRAWIQIEKTQSRFQLELPEPIELHIVNGIALFTFAPLRVKEQETEKEPIPCAAGL